MIFESKPTYNQTTRPEDYTNKPYPKEKLRPRAFCSSHTCSPNQYAKLGVEKYVSLAVVDCKECGSALYWTTDPHDHSYL